VSTGSFNILFILIFYIDGEKWGLLKRQEENPAFLEVNPL
jgi:hypothetical protein